MLFKRFWFHVKLIISSNNKYVKAIVKIRKKIITYKKTLNSNSEMQKKIRFYGVTLGIWLDIAGKKSAPASPEKLA